MGKIQKIKWIKGQTMDQWGEVRKEIEGIGHEHTRIGASDISVITGSNKYKCPARLFYHLTGEHSSFHITETTLAGHLMEPITVQRWESFSLDEQEALHNTLNKVKLRKLTKANYFLLNSDYPFLFVSLDYVAGRNQFSPFTGEKYHPMTPNELKHTNWNFYSLWQNGITQSHLEQVNQQMMVSNTKLAVFHTLIDGVKYKVMEVPRDEELCKYIAFKGKEFADLVTVGKAFLYGRDNAESESEREEYQAMFDEVTPDPVGMQDNIDFYQEIYDEGNDLSKLGDDSDDFIMSQYLKTIKVVNNIEDYKKQLRASILKSCEDFEGIHTDSFKCINRRAKDGKKAYFSVKVIK